jgi:formylglycine-generating enzyme required for sulfatase activity
MSDIFISYASEDRGTAQLLAQVLAAQGWTVWWDPKIPPGKTYDEVIEEALDNSRCVVVLWSKVSASKRWVKTEAAEGNRRRILIPALIEDNVKIPLEFRLIEAARLTDWRGAQSGHGEFDNFVVAIQELLGKPAKVTEATLVVAQPSVIKAERYAPGTIFQDTLEDGSSGPEMVVIPAGSFHMGDIHGLGRDDEKPVHTVHIRNPFVLGRYHVTLDEYDKYARLTRRELPTDCGWGRGRRPVISVSWDDAVEYSKWLSTQTGKPYRLPTEAEWEYAARSGGKDEIWSGTSDEKQLVHYARFSKTQTAPVGNRKPNGIGLYDMSGNVWEWVEDCWHENYNGAPIDGFAWLKDGGGDCGRRVIRGGSWNFTPVYLRSSSRLWYLADLRDSFIGFRLARDLE